MNIIKGGLIACLFLATAAIAEPASEASIKQLLTITQTQKLVESMRAQFDSLMNNSIQQSLQGKAPTVKQQKAITNMKNKMVAVMQEAIAWEKMEPMYVRLYKETFTEEEVAGMLAFYKTPAGQAVIHKMPLLVQKSMMDIQKTAGSMMPKMKKIQEQFISEMDAASK